MGTAPNKKILIARNLIAGLALSLIGGPPAILLGFVLLPTIESVAYLAINSLYQMGKIARGYNKWNRFPIFVAFFVIFGGLTAAFAGLFFFTPNEVIPVHIDQYLVTIQALLVLVTVADYIRISEEAKSDLNYDQAAKFAYILGGLFAFAIAAGILGAALKSANTSLPANADIVILLALFVAGKTYFDYKMQTISKTKPLSRS